MHIILLHEFQTLPVFYLSVYSELECLVHCLRQLCCLCANFCYSASRDFMF